MSPGPSICFRIPDTVLIYAFVYLPKVLHHCYDNILIWRMFYIVFNCISASLFLFLTKFYIYYRYCNTHMHSRYIHALGCCAQDLHCAKFLYPAWSHLMNYECWERLLSEFSFVSQLIYRSIVPKSAFCIILSVPMIELSYLRPPVL